MTKIRKQILLDRDQEMKLRTLAGRWHSSEAEVLRIGLDRLYEDDAVPPTVLDDLNADEGHAMMSEEEIAALEDEIDRWAHLHPRPLGLSEAVLADREGR
jgi:hypothetical protein